MGVGPAIAISTAVKAASLELDDIDLFEINVKFATMQAFASQFGACPNKLELDPEKVNVNGGATGARCVATLLHEMKHCGKDYCFGVISMCLGTLSPFSVCK
ncbi:3-ketoacyl-CoA thiolase 2, peroxisomal-like [Castanea sativa]|uniref:3-ketoacyl-CoA thiolase 2, peroxisomal-like n=1 Tax=Castanea sativa TaxID=21020 RepID=UPI003F64A08B